MGLARSFYVQNEKGRSQTQDAAGLGLSTILSANAANTAADYAKAAQRSNDPMQAKAVSGAVYEMHVNKMLIEEMLIEEMLSSGSFSEGEAIATGYDGRLYVIGYNTIEPDL